MVDASGVEQEEVVDEEAERKQKEEKDRKLIEDGDAEETVEIEIGDAFGETEEDLEAEKKEEASKSAELKARNEKIAAVMAQDLPDDAKAAALEKLLNVTTEEVTIS